MKNPINPGKIFLAMLAMLTLAFLPLLIPSAQAGIEFNVVEPFEVEFEHPCTGQLVHLVGTDHALFHVEGEHRDSFHLNSVGKGEIVATGEKCQFQNTVNDQCTSSTQCGFDLDADDFDLTSRENVRVICQGRAANFIVTEIVHVTFPPLEVEVLHENARCVE